MQPLTRKARINIERKLRALNGELAKQVHELEGMVTKQHEEINILNKQVADLISKSSAKKDKVVTNIPQKMKDEELDKMANRQFDSVIDGNASKQKVVKKGGSGVTPRMKNSVRTNVPKIKKAGGTKFGTPGGSNKSQA